MKVRKLPVAVLSMFLAALVATPAQARVMQAGSLRVGTSDESTVYERDVYVIVVSTLRHPDETTADAAPLFGESGINLGVTWGQWKAAAGTASLMVGGRAQPSTMVNLELTGLIPGGVYSVFYGTLNPDSENPACPGVERTLPLTSMNPRQKPDPSSFVANKRGKASYTGTAAGDLLAPLQTFFSIVYHSDGAAHHPFPNLGEAQSVANGTQPCRSSFGLDAMRQEFVFVNR